MRAEHRKMSDLWKTFESAFLMAGEAVESFEVRSVLSLVSLYLDEHSTQELDKSFISNEIISLHPCAMTSCASHLTSGRGYADKFKGIIDTLSSVSELSIVLGGLHQWCLHSSLSQNDSKSRKKIGAYYTPKHVVDGMARRKALLKRIQ